MSLPITDVDNLRKQLETARARKGTELDRLKACVEAASKGTPADSKTFAIQRAASTINGAAFNALDPEKKVELREEQIEQARALRQSSIAALKQTTTMMAKTVRETSLFSPTELDARLADLRNAKPTAGLPHPA